ncbi:protein phosphatase 1 regulatory subunit 26 [Cyprinodon tularosa]|uniref:protein phosphatase 1 regulatory subunit 26 n=1 Tax=Cyprinodon tularosa TaxID=77115 RepID=UPI0018E25E2E|nr:protein phosphatase 1 regulatory subunit 26 [Cyprinodon tularosa]
MYLMNVPPVAATETEWRRCCPPGGYSLPVCFNDSDAELSTRGTAISDKVQMIIESLRSSQSSLEMGDEIEANMPSGQERHTQVCKAGVGNYVGVKSKRKKPTENPHARFSLKNNHDSSDSDSDDSVDRGIEEAILEYLKEKDGHKRKAEPSSSFLKSSKMPRKNPPTLECARQRSEDDSSLRSNSQPPISVKTESPITTATVPLKKYIKNKASQEENFDLSKFSTDNSLGSKEQQKSPSETIRICNKTTQHPVIPKIEEHLSDSSSDDGIEEAIQRYQLEQKGLQNKREYLNPQTFQEDSDSTSDDGIEEAIRSYQLEQQKENSFQKQLLYKPKAPIKLSVPPAESKNSEMRTNKLKRKKGKLTQTPSVSKPKTSLSNSAKGKGNGLLSLKETFKEQSSPTPSKVKTSAELMCAEAILDISKTVMPGAFHQGIGLNTFALAGPSSLPDRNLHEESNDSSVDSEDGIEQEIRKFLEQKALMHKQPATAQQPCDVLHPEKGKGGDAAVQQKPQKLSLTQRRKQMEKSVTLTNISETADKIKETAEHTKESKASTLPMGSQSQPSTALQRTDQSGDKSSSFDSDEDLDTAIKDLLKTKKKSKKKIKDLKKKPKKSIKDAEPLSGNAFPNKKLQHKPGSKCSALKKVQRSDADVKDKLGFSKNILHQKQMDKSETADSLRGEELDTKPLQIVDPHLEIDDDSSSVDSNDSIELEIRRFLAEKAKVSSGDKSDDVAMSKNGSYVVQDTDVQFPVVDVKQETQLAEIPLKPNSPLSVPQVRTPQRIDPEITSNSPESCATSIQSCSPSLLEPADGAGATRNQQMRTNAASDAPVNGTQHVERVHPALSQDRARSLAESIKWRQSLGLPVPDPKTLSWTSFHITSLERLSSSENRDLKSQTPTSAWCTPRTSRAPFSNSTDVGGNTPVRPPVLKFSPAARQHSKMTFTQSLTPGNRSQFSLEEGRASTVHVPKDKSVFVELETNRTNHVQVQSRERSEGKKADSLNERKREGKSKKMYDEGAHQDREDEEFIDESDCESGSKRDPDKKQGFPALSLSTAIDPGITFSPCIALSTEKRCMIFSRQYLVRKRIKENPSNLSAFRQTGTLQHVRRKLQFVPTDVRRKAVDRI